MKSKLICIIGIFASLISHAMQNDSEYLVIGSTRGPALEYTFPITELWDERNADISHIKTFGGKAMTVDKKASFIQEGAHIVADITQHRFKENSIKHVYLERLPTADFDLSGLIQKGDCTNYLGKCITNIHKSMTQDAIMEIEWSPYLVLSMLDPDNVTSIFEQDRIEQNPFTCTIGIDLALSAIRSATKKHISFSNAENISQKFIDLAHLLGQTIDRLLTFYEQEKVGTKNQLIQRLNEEVWLLNLFLIKEKGNFALLKHGPNATLADFSSAVKEFAFIPRIRAIIENLELGSTINLLQDGKLLTGIVYNVNTFLRDSLINFILCDAFIEHTQSNALDFMLKNGFKNVSIKRKRSIHNNRNNVWTIEAIKE